MLLTPTATVVLLIVRTVGMQCSDEELGIGYPLRLPVSLWATGGWYASEDAERRGHSVL